jgi:hypothetical protein
MRLVETNSYCWTLNSYGDKYIAGARRIGGVAGSRCSADTHMCSVRQSGDLRDAIEPERGGMRGFDDVHGDELRNGHVALVGNGPLRVGEVV